MIRKYGKTFIPYMWNSIKPIPEEAYWITSTTFTLWEDDEELGYIGYKAYFI